MDHIMVMIILRGFLSVFFVATGLTALIIGARLYRSGVGLAKDGTTVNIKKIKGSLQTVGAVVMATSVAWGLFAYLSLPSYSGSNTPGFLVNINSPTKPKIDITGEDLRENFEKYNSSNDESFKFLTIILIRNQLTELAVSKGYSADGRKATQIGNADINELERIAKELGALR